MKLWLGVEPLPCRKLPSRAVHQTHSQSKFSISFACLIALRGDLTWAVCKHPWTLLTSTRYGSDQRKRTVGMAEIRTKRDQAAGGRQGTWCRGGFKRLRKTSWHGVSIRYSLLPLRRIENTTEIRDWITREGNLFWKTCF